MELRAFNLLGQQVLARGFAAGQESIRFVWSARDDAGKPLSSGPYVFEARLLGDEGMPERRLVTRVLYAK